MGSHKPYTRDQVRRALARTMRHFRRRAKARLSQEELANLADVDRSYVGEIERGLRSATVETLCRLLPVLDVSCAEFGAEFDKNLQRKNNERP